MNSQVLRKSCSFSSAFLYNMRLSFNESNIIQRHLITIPNGSILSRHKTFGTHERQVSRFRMLDSLLQPTKLHRLYCKQSGDPATTNPQGRHGPTISRNRLAWQTSFRDFIESKDISAWKLSDWDYVAQEMSLSNGPSWDILCMHTLYKDNQLILGRSLMSYLEQRGEQVSNIILTFYIGLLGKTSTSPEQDDETKSYFDKLLSESDYLDPASIEVLTTGLSNTRYYKECSKLVSMCQESSSVGDLILSNVLIASLRYKDKALCDSTLSLMDEKAEAPNLAHLVLKIFDVSLGAKNEEGLITCMNYLKKHGLLIPMELKEKIIECFKRHQPNAWNIQTSFINQKSGRCIKCQFQMEKNEISEEEFEAIQKVFLDQVIVGGNIFYKTTPEEVEHFVRFVKKNGPYDVVIDGLNLIHRYRHRDVLYNTIKHFQDEKKKVLVLGSKILTRHTASLKRLQRKPNIYMTNTTKADDAFFLYAALQSGNDTLIVTNDKLRDHKFLMGPTHSHLFQKWLKAAQICDLSISRDGNLIDVRRHLYSLGPCKGPAGWHLPLNDVSFDNPYGKCQVLCVHDARQTTSQQKETHMVSMNSTAKSHVKPSDHMLKKTLKSKNQNKNKNRRTKKENLIDLDEHVRH